MTITTLAISPPPPTRSSSRRPTTPSVHQVDPVPPEVSALEALQLATAGAVLVDVREPHEWVLGHAPQAVHMPMAEVSERIGAIPEEAMVVCVCHLGARSAAVASALRRSGRDALNLSGGMEAWASAGLPVVDSDGQPGRVLG